MANSCPVLVILIRSVKSEARPFAEGEGKVEGSEIERNGASIDMSGL